MRTNLEYVTFQRKFGFWGKISYEMQPEEFESLGLDFAYLGIQKELTSIKIYREDYLDRIYLKSFAVRVGRDSLIVSFSGTEIMEKMEMYYSTPEKETLQTIGDGVYLYCR